MLFTSTTQILYSHMDQLSNFWTCYFVLSHLLWSWTVGIVVAYHTWSVHFWTCCFILSHLLWSWSVGIVVAYHTWSVHHMKSQWNKHNCWKHKQKIEMSPSQSAGSNKCIDGIWGERTNQSNNASTWQWSIGHLIHKNYNDTNWRQWL